MVELYFKQNMGGWCDYLRTFNMFSWRCWTLYVLRLDCYIDGSTFRRSTEINNEFRPVRAGIPKTNYCHPTTIWCYVGFREIVFLTLGIQSPCQMMIRVYNHLLRKVLRFHYHSQKVIGSIGLDCRILCFGVIQFLSMAGLVWTLVPDCRKPVLFRRNLPGR